jgi:hypothetical protein
MTEFLDVTGRRIPYDMNGIGPMVVLSHGIGDRRPAYRFLAPIPTQAGYGVARTCVGTATPAWAGRPSTKPSSRARTAIRKALDASINFIDAADGDSNGAFEEILGKGVRGPSH